ncbi:hypothetical protein, partial [Paenibacillus germinis]|uniref:hypothetical protein n=1 Tax=Paenibacillus germinis TaxID=2654979 RepID=UPI001C129583
LAPFCYQMVYCISMAFELHGQISDSKACFEIRAMLLLWPLLLSVGGMIPDQLKKHLRAADLVTTLTH